MKKILLLSIIYTLVLLVPSCTPPSKMRLIAEQQRGLEPKVVPQPNNTITHKAEPKIIKNDGGRGATIPITPLRGDLIQTGGRVKVLAHQMLIDLDLAGDNVPQILAIKSNIQENWHYVHDPARSEDTWRAADITIQSRYKGKFPGDCDDFAILLASLAREIGLDSRVSAGFNSTGGGHAWAEFKVNSLRNNIPGGTCYSKESDGIWVSLDWFDGSDHTQYAEQSKVIAK